MTNTIKQQENTLLDELEARILTGQLKAGDLLPSERNLSEELSLSRPVIHNVLTRLQDKGLVKILPRKGTVVEDFMQTGKMDVISSLVRCYGAELSHSYRHSLLNLFKGQTDLMIADIIQNEYDARLETVKDTLSEAVSLMERKEKAQSITGLYTALAEASVNPFFRLYVNSTYDAIHSVALAIANQDSVYHTFLQLWTSLLKQLKNKDGEKAYAINQTLFDLIINKWQ